MKIRKKIGKFWKRKLGNLEFAAGEVSLEGKVCSLAVFPNRLKKRPEHHDFNVFLIIREED